jgi:arylsulfatase A-like enzyme
MPGLAPDGQRAPQVVSLVDIVPTALDAAGLEIPEEIEGRSLVPDLRGRHAPLISAGFSSKWDTENARETSWTARVGDWKLRMRGPANSYLYDLSRDAREQTDYDTENPIALRAARIALGQFLGAPNRRSWTSNAVAGVAPTVQHEDEEAEMTPELCAQLRALGYIVDCE